jgi:hypothetical protein
VRSHAKAPADPSRHVTHLWDLRNSSGIARLTAKSDQQVGSSNRRPRGLTVASDGLCAHDLSRSSHSPLPVADAHYPGRSSGRFVARCPDSSPVAWATSMR